MARIDFFGLGEMGYAIAGHLANAGHALAPHDLQTQRVAAWQQEFGARQAHGPAEFLITSITDLETLLALAHAPDGIAGRLKPGVLWIDHTTTSPPGARACAELAAAHGAAFIDVPMSGGAAGARAGELALFAGGAAADIARARPLLQSYCNHLTHLGAVGSGQAAKLAHQLAIAGTLLGLSAAIEYGAAQGLAAADVLGALKQGTARSIQLNQHAEKMSAADFDFARDFAWLAKDLAVVDNQAPALAALLCTLVQPPSDKEGSS